LIRKNVALTHEAGAYDRKRAKTVTYPELFMNASFLVAV
jgi:hypothetical protein